MVKKQKISYTSPNEGFWPISGVDYRGEIGTFKLFEKMTPAMTQDHLSEFYERERAKGNPYPMDSVLHFAIMNAFYDIRNVSPMNKKFRDFLQQNSEKLRNFLQTGFQRHLNTLTRIIYNPSGEDKIIHNYKTSDEYSIDEHVVGPDDWMKDIQDKKVLEVLLRTQDVVQIDKVSQWINKTNTCIWRLNSEPKTKDERVVSFRTFPYRFIFDCSESPLGEHPAFRVLRVD